MNTPLNNLVIYNGYPLSIVVALVIHIMIFLTLLYLQSSSDSQSLELVQPTVIKALFIDDNPQLRNQQLRGQRRVEQRREAQQQEESPPLQSNFDLCKFFEKQHIPHSHLYTSDAADE